MSVRPVLLPTGVGSLLWRQLRISVAGNRTRYRVLFPARLCPGSPIRQRRHLQKVEVVGSNPTRGTYKLLLCGLCSRIQKTSNPLRI